MTVDATEHAPRILVVDDNEAGRYVTVRTLQNGGYHVREARSGREALHASREAPDLIVLDVNLPDISGFDVARTLRAEQGAAGAPIMMVSAAHLTDADRVHGLDHGADTYLTHPVEPGVLLATVRALLRARFAEAELRQLNRELECKVAQRTAELEQRNAALEAKSAALARQKSRLEQANADLESFAYSVSHDLRTPLRHISSFSGLLRRRIEQQADAQAIRYLDTVERSAWRMDALIEALLTFSRFGRLELQRGPVNLNALTREVQAELATEMANRQVTWRLGTLPVVHGDERLLRLVLLNLLGNAVKFTARRDEAVIEVWGEEHPGRSVVFVRDNGAGFDPRYQGKLFGVFQRLHHEREFEGTGLGLANVKRIVQRHGGTVQAEGQPGEGALFSFSLPCGQENAAQLKIRSAEPQ